METEPKGIDDNEMITEARKWFDANLQSNAAAGRQTISKKNPLGKSLYRAGPGSSASGVR
jgi:hypothetical protein